MSKRFLVTTSLEQTWPKDNKPVLFLGEWCCRYSRRHHWESLDAKVIPYHWDDRSKLYKDYLYLQTFYERLLGELTIQLNHIHNVDQSVRYWRILVGPWLFYFVQILFDRWETIQRAIIQYDISETIILIGQDEQFIPNDMHGFESLFVRDDWNHHIYSKILQNFLAPNQFKKKLIKTDVTTEVGSLKKSWRQNLRLLMSKITSFVCRDKDVFLLSTYLPLREEIKLSCRLAQAPQFWRRESVAKVKVNYAFRERMGYRLDEITFESFVRFIIPQQIPILYLEGYSQLIEQINRLPWPKQPKLIWTGIAQCSDEVFKAWVGKKVDDGIPLVIGQHGGVYGIAKWTSWEKHEVSICDSYLSWGWSDLKQPKIVPVGQLKVKKSLQVLFQKKKRALLVTLVSPRFSYHMYAGPISSQWIDYFKDQCTFIDSLPELIQQEIIVRLYSHDYGWDQELRWRNRFPDIMLDNGKSNMGDLIRQSRLYISTYNSTTYLESFAMNVPTVIYWNTDHWELRESAIPYFAELKRVGIFHETPQSAARHVAIIWDNVDIWWNSPSVRDVLERFKTVYCRSSKGLLDRIKYSLRATIDDA